MEFFGLHFLLVMITLYEKQMETQLKKMEYDEANKEKSWASTTGRSSMVTEPESQSVNFNGHRHVG